MASTARIEGNPQRIHQGDQVKAFVHDISSKFIGPEGITPPEADESLEIIIRRSVRSRLGGENLVEEISIKQDGHTLPDGTKPTQVGIFSDGIGRIYADSHTLRKLQIGDTPLHTSLTLWERASQTPQRGLEALGRLHTIFDRLTLRNLPTQKSSTSAETLLHDPDTLIGMPQTRRSPSGQ